jgi:1,6-anhydro-N-acetylmuramate kinase
MTGTSIDALDVALVAIDGHGLEMCASLLRANTRPLGPLAGRLRSFAAQGPLPAGEIARLAHEFSALHVAAIADLLAGDRADLIAIHGQTVFHAPPLSWQLLNPALIAHALQAPVVFDLRAADLAAGGQGAPITPLADHVLFRDAAETRAVVNFGGYCNFTLLPRSCGIEAIRGGDICACNHLLDSLARDLFNEPFDAEGRHALAGAIRAGPRDALAELLRAQARGGRSLGTGDESAGWLAQFRGSCSSDDVARSACDALAGVIVEIIQGTAPDVDAYLLAGGGVKNRALYGALVARCGERVDLTDRYGVPAAYREAASIAVLGALCQDRVPITLPAITGVPSPAPIAGAWILPG